MPDISSQKVDPYYRFENNFPDIPGHRENWPEHIYQCLGCDGFEQRGTPIGILQFDNLLYSHMVQMATPFNARVTIFCNKPISVDAPVQRALKSGQAFGVGVDGCKIYRLANNGPFHTDSITIELETIKPVTLGFLVHKPDYVNREQHLIHYLGSLVSKLWLNTISNGRFKMLVAWMSPMCSIIVVKITVRLCKDPRRVTTCEVLLELARTPSAHQLRNKCFSIVTSIWNSFLSE
jgi:hypothetical protein